MWSGPSHINTLHTALSTHTAALKILKVLFWGWRKVKKRDYQFRYVCPSVRPRVTTLRPVHGFSLNFTCGTFPVHVSTKIQSLVKIRKEKNNIPTWMYSRSLDSYCVRRKCRRQLATNFACQIPFVRNNYTIRQRRTGHGWRKNRDSHAAS